MSSNFSVGSIYSVWPALENNLIGQKLETQVNALLAIYGPRTTVTFLDLLDNHVKELTLVEDKWILSHNHLVIKPDTKIFSPGNLRAGSEN